MSELITSTKGSGVRRQLLITVSAAVLCICFGVSERVHATETDQTQSSERPSVWIDLGGQFDQVGGGLTPVIMPAITSPPFDHPGPSTIVKAPSLGYDFDAKITLEPADSDWVFSAALRYGRSARGPKAIHDQTYKHITYYFTTAVSLNTFEKTVETHAIVDFAAGKDVGLGLWGTRGRSVFSLGLKFAQFSSGTDADIDFDLTAHYSAGGAAFQHDHFHSIAKQMQHSFTGFGPSLSWDASVPLTRAASEGISLDWGVDAAVLFGKQKAQMHSSSHFQYKPTPYHITDKVSHYTSIRNKNAIVPNVGGFAGLSYRYSNAKLSFGYRADMFFDAIDGGLKTRATYDRGFYGPFAQFSVGIGG